VVELLSWPSTYADRQLQFLRESLSIVIERERANRVLKTSSYSIAYDDEWHEIYKLHD